ncbi:MarR family transcriptional regulator [Gordonia sp. PKS22-38]|uniref:MarR family transcriptional regulator n=1 Tax=Gordonia prachuapensis TaxID=3115651 RepID=A0ABU7MYR7_9ACTN|nr:MarR family transcriptional regulator [Gordonia sp. PKS22-38]
MDRDDDRARLLRSFGIVTKGLRHWANGQISADNSSMTIGRAAVLSGLAASPEPMSMSDIGALLDLSARSMTVLADGLEKNKWVRRIPHPEDRRVTLIELTDEGRAYAADHVLPAQLAAAAIFDDLTVDERQTLQLLLTKVARSLADRGVPVAQAHMESES